MIGFYGKIIKGVDDMHSNESKEMYLKTIMQLSQKLDVVRAVDIAKEFNYSKASVSKALSNLIDEGDVYYDDHKYVFLTKTGIVKANDVIIRHEVISQFLEKTLKINEEVASADACRIEHVISDDVFQAMQAYIMGE